MTLYPIALTVALAAQTRPASAATRHGAAWRGAGTPTVVAVTVTPGRLAPTDTATMVATLYNGGPTQGPYVATLQLQRRAGGADPAAEQGGISLHHGQRLSVYWEWRAGTSLPPGVYTVRVTLHEPGRPDETVASAAAGAPLTVLAR